MNDQEPNGNTYLVVTVQRKKRRTVEDFKLFGIAVWASSAFWVWYGDLDGWPVAIYHAAAAVATLFVMAPLLQRRPGDTIGIRVVKRFTLITLAAFMGLGVAVGVTAAVGVS